MMREEGAPAGPKGIFCLMLEDGMEGFSYGKKEDKLGWNSQPTRILNFDNVKVGSSSEFSRDKVVYRFQSQTR